MENLFDLVPTTDDRPLVLLHPVTGDELTAGGHVVRLFIRSPENPVMKAADRSKQNRRLKQAARTGRLNLTAEELEVDNIDKLAAAISGWENVYRDGEPLAYSPEAAKQLLKLLPWVREQVAEFYGEAASFLKASTTTLPTG